MLLHYRNTYKTKKIMLLYGFLSIISLMIVTAGIMLITIFNYWWLYVLTVVFLFGFFFNFLLLMLENNDYKLKYYYSKKKYKELYEELINKYNIETKEIKKIIKRETKDCFYQYGKLYEDYKMIKHFVMSDWLEKCLKEKRTTQKKDFNLFIYDLLIVSGLYGDYKININTLINIYNKEEVSKELEKCPFIKKEFEEKILFIFDSPFLISEEYLKNMYFEIIYVAQGIIGLISEEEFNFAMYNNKYNYTNDKMIAYYIKEKDNKFVIIKKDFDCDYEEELNVVCVSEKDALSVIKDCIKINNEESNKKGDSYGNF